MHDGDISPFLAALGILSEPNEPHLPTTHVVADRAWQTSTILPMGARVTIERLTCSSEHKGTFIRVNINDRITPLPFCKSGPGRSCDLDSFMAYVRQRGQEVGDFGEVCDLQGHSKRITFLRQG